MGDVNDQLSVSALLRAAADGELDVDQQARLDAHLREHPQDEARIAFESQLRQACGRVMGPSSTPAGLRDRVVARLESEAEQELIAERIEARAAETRNPNFWNRLTPMVQSVAAAVLLLVGGVFLFQVLNIGSGSVAQAHMSEIATFVGDEHNRCIIDPSRAAKFGINELESAPAILQEIIGKSISPADLAIGGLAFRDGGRCQVPGKGESVHLRFDVVEQPGETVSLFIQQVASESDELFEDGKSYEMKSDNIAGNRLVYGWTIDGLNYFLVAQNRELCEDYSIASGLTLNDG